MKPLVRVMQLHRGLHSMRGLAAVEMAVVLPIILLLLLITMDFGQVFYTAMGVTHAARAGAEYGAQNNGKAVDFLGMCNIAKAEANNSIPNFPGGMCDPKTSYFSDTADGKVFTVISYNNANPGPCGQQNAQCQCWDGTNETEITPCSSSCTTGQEKRVYACMSVTATFTTEINYPGIPHVIPITRTIRMRAQ